MLRKERSSLIVKIIAAFIGLAFVGSLIIGVLPSFMSSESSQEPTDNVSQDYAKRVDELEKALKEQPDQPNILYELGGVYYQWGDILMQSKKAKEATNKYDKAIQTLQKSLKLKPNQELLALLGNVYFDWGSALKTLAKEPDSDAKFKEAIGYYQQYLDANPNNSDVRTDMGIAYYQREDAKTAIGEFKKVLKADPKHVNALYNLGLVSYDSGKKDEAAKAWKQYLELEPQGPNAEYVQAKLKELETKK